MRNKIVTTRLGDEEYKVLEMISTHERHNLSESIRWLIRGEATRRGMPTGLVDYFKHLPPVLTEVSHE